MFFFWISVIYIYPCREAKRTLVHATVDKKKIFYYFGQ